MVQYPELILLLETFTMEISSFINNQFPISKPMVHGLQLGIQQFYNMTSNMRLMSNHMMDTITVI